MVDDHASPMSPTLELVTCGDAAPPREVRRRVVDLLASGAIVALPTETVYGFAARADDAAAVAALRELKGSPADRPLTWHVGDASAVERFEHVRALTRRLVQRYWPGPLTLVLEGVPAGLEGVTHEGWTGVRFPAHLGTAAILAQADFPVVMTSANRASEAPLTRAPAIAEAFAGSAQVALVLDGGPARLGEPSGVLRLGRGAFALLREGLLPVADLRRTAGLRIAFCCTGNTCRSPMAEGLARHRIAQALGCAADEDGLAAFGFSVRSMGVAAGAGERAAPHAIAVLSELGIDLSGHRSAPAILADVVAADRVYCMTASHLEALRAMLPPARAKHVVLIDPHGEDVPDPIGGSAADYATCAERIDAAIRGRLGDWVTGA